MCRTQKLRELSTLRTRVAGESVRGGTTVTLEDGLLFAGIVLFGMVFTLLILITSVLLAAIWIDRRRGL